MRGIVVDSAANYGNVMFVKIAVLSATMHCQKGREWNFGPRPSVVNVKIYPGNLTPEQMNNLSNIGTETLLRITLGEETLVEEVAYAHLHPVRGLDEFIKALNDVK
ncbi:MAG: hypothetical protein IJ532_03695 [Alphaproteobacteria bacterium]|nr:hypothetical protein [Alphaproteobacteria bacterium]